MIPLVKEAQEGWVTRFGEADIQLYIDDCDLGSPMHKPIYPVLVSLAR